MNKSVLIALLVVTLLGGWMLTGLFLGGEDESDLDAAAGEQEEATRFRVQVIESEAREVAREIVLAGRTTASRQVVLRAEVFGRVEEILVDEGQAVATGTPLLRLETRDRERRVAFLEALVEQREIELAATRRLVTQELRPENELAAARSALEQAEADLEDARLALENTILEAPFGGVVGERHVEVGDFVNVGTEIMPFYELDPLVIVAHATEREVGVLHKGEKAHVVLATGHETEAVVRFVAPAADEVSRTFKVEMTLPNPQARFPSGLSAEVVLETELVRAHRVSPSVLTLSDEGQVGVKAVDDDDEVQFYPIEIVKSDREGAWVAGLPEATDIITVGMYFTRVGEKVDPIPAGQTQLLEQPEVAARNDGAGAPVGTGSSPEL